MVNSIQKSNKPYLKFYLFGTLLWITLLIIFFLLKSYFPGSKIFEIIGYPLVLFGIFGIPVIFFFSLIVRIGEFFINKIDKK